MNAAPKVFFIDMHTKHRYNLLNKFDHMLTKAGIDKIDFENKLTAIKLHFSEPGNLAYVRPNYAACVVKKCVNWAESPSPQTAMYFTGEKEDTLSTRTGAFSGEYDRGISSGGCYCRCPPYNRQDSHPVFPASYTRI